MKPVLLHFLALKITEFVHPQRTFDNLRHIRQNQPMNHWLMKSEPNVFSIQDLKKKGRSLWDGVRNYQARNFMTQSMKVGDTVLFYHSSSEPPGLAGLARICGPAVPDPTQFDKNSEYFDPKATKEKPIWSCVEVEFVKAFKTLLPLEQIRAEKKLSDLPLLQRGQRLSIQPVTPKQFEQLLKLAGESPA